MRLGLAIGSAWSPWWWLRLRSGAADAGPCRRVRVRRRLWARPRSTPPETGAPAQSSERRGSTGRYGRRTVVRRHERLRRPAGPRHLLQHRFHARGLGAESRRTKNDVGILGTWAGNGPMLWIDHLASRYQLTLGSSLSSYLDSGVNPDRRPVAAPRSHLRRHDRALLRQRRRGGLTGRLRQPSALEHVADRRLRQHRRRLLRRPHRRASRLRPRAERGRDAGRHEPAARDHRPRRTHRTGEPHRHGQHADRRSRSAGRPRPTTSASPATPSMSDGAVVGNDDRNLVHRHRPRLLDGPSARGRGFRRSREHVAARRGERIHDCLCDTTPGLVAAYAFDEGSGTTANDASGNGKNGAITGAHWVTGRNGGGLSFDGVDDNVALGTLGTFYNRLHARGVGAEGRRQEGRRHRRHLGR